MLSDQEIDNLCSEWLYVAPNRTYEEHRPFARAIESAATAPLLARIAELERELEEARKDAMHEAALICDHLDAEVDKYPAACAKAIREAAGVEAASQSDRMVLVPFSIDDCDEIVEAACNAGSLYRVDFIRAWQAAIRAAIKEQT